MIEQNRNHEGTSNPPEKNEMGIAAGIHPALYGKVTLPQRPEQPIQAEAPAAKAEPSKRRTMRRAPKKAGAGKGTAPEQQGNKGCGPAGKKAGAEQWSEEAVHPDLLFGRPE